MSSCEYWSIDPAVSIRPSLVWACVLEACDAQWLSTNLCLVSHLSALSYSHGPSRILNFTINEYLHHLQVAVKSHSMPTVTGSLQK